jgi:cytochrome b involved in lipid metabolism
VHGNTLTAATVLHSVPPEAPEVLLVGCTSKVGGAVACALALRGVRVLMVTSAPERFEAVRARVAALDPEGQAADRLVMCTGLEDGQQCATWLAGKWLSAKDQRLIPAHGTVLYFCFPPPQPIRTDIAYINIGCLRVDPLRVEGLGNCTADLDRGVFHACHVGTIVHALEGWTHHEVGEVDMAAMEAAWEAAQRHGFRLTAPVARLLQGRPLSPRTSTSRSPSADALSASPTPTMTAAHVAQAAQDGQPLIIIEDWVHDVGEFLENHPGGAAILRKYYGRDATPAFNGERYNHSRAARAILARLRVAKLVTSVPKPRHPDADP